MNVAETNLKMIDRRIEEIDEKIAALKKERSALLAARGDVHLTYVGTGPLATDVRNIEKLKTLGRAREVLVEKNRPLSTPELMRLIQVPRSETRNPITVRSHLRRLRMEGFLKFDEASKRWSLPESKGTKE